MTTSAAPEGQGRELLRAFSDAVLAMTADLSVESILQRIVDSARRLVGAQYAAIGLPDDDAGFASFITSGISEEQRTAIGYLPRFHGILGAMLSDPEPLRIDDIAGDARFRGWPDAHPDMKSFLGVPIVNKQRIVGAFYLAHDGAARFESADEELIRIFASHAALAIENARLYEASRELTVVEERNRLARDLHDSVSQSIFGLVLGAEAAQEQIVDDPKAARDRLAKVQELARDAYRQLRELIADLRPGDIRSEGLGVALAKHVDLTRRLHGAHVVFSSSDDVTEGVLETDQQRELFFIAQEALNNAIRHARAKTVSVELETKGGATVLRVADDGGGFEPGDVASGGKGLGLTSMKERAARLGWHLVIDSAHGTGTTIEVRTGE